VTGARDAPLTPAEQRLRVLLLANAVIAVAFVAIYLAGAIWDGEQFRFVVNSVAKDGLFAALCLLGAANVRRNGWMALLVAFGYVCLIISEAVMLAVGGQDAVTSFGTTLDAVPYLVSWMAADVVLAAALVVCWWMAVKERHQLRYLNPLAFRALVALSEVLIEGDREDVPPVDIARNVDSYLAALEARNKTRVHLALTALAVFPLLALRMPLAAMAPHTRKRYLEQRFIADVARRRVFAPLRPTVQAMIRVAAQMSYLGYYGDERSWPGIGFKPYSKRAGGRLPRPEDRPGPALRSLNAPPRDRYDAIVIGSGAGGAIIAYRLAEAGRRVLVVERGPHADPATFGEDEVGQLLKLYNEGALQLATDYRLQVLQGMCVGGGTTVNNAICIAPPGEVLDRWTERGIDPDGLRSAIDQVAGWLPVRRMEAKVASKGGLAFAKGARRAGLPGSVELVEANISAGCLGCGYCNMGCGFGFKQSMLDSVLPWAQRDFPDRLDVLADFKAERIVHRDGRATGVAGTHRGEAFTFEADEIVVAAGAVASSWLLQRSGIGGDRAGAELYFNINSPLTAEFPRPVDSYAGLQMSHVYRPGGPDERPPFLLETWFNPPASQALAMPGWFDAHYRNMRRYNHMACGGALVGTTSPARVKATRSGPEIEYTPSREDLSNLVIGLETLGRIYFAAGADRVMPATFAWHEFSSPGALDGLSSIVDSNADLLLTSAHPQGGNPVGEQSQGGVVDEDFRVHGFGNLYVTDASVFPSSVAVNPQLTVMGIAQYAAGRITGVAPRIITQTPLPVGTEPAQPPVRASESSRL
jgi:choline dehydrogenase-like flavoprotein